MCAFFIITGCGGNPGIDFLFFFGYNQLCLFSTLILSKLALQMEHAKCSLSKTKPRVSWHWYDERDASTWTTRAMRNIEETNGKTCNSINLSLENLTSWFIFRPLFLVFMLAFMEQIYTFTFYFYYQSRVVFEVS